MNAFVRILPLNLGASIIWSEVGCDRHEVTETAMGFSMFREPGAPDLLIADGLVMLPRVRLRCRT